MAQKIQVLLIDDIDGSKADESVTFALDGVNFEIDLTNEHAAQLRDDFAKWVGAARKVSSRGPARVARSTRRSSSDADTIRQWARANGHKVSDRGRIPQSVRDAYESAH
ncbi:MAG: Lsr2 family protein [Actinomycetota bacterium]|nr:Lsr2 family protein [Actinomycetota bacterium]